MARIGGKPLPTITDDRALGVADIQRSLRFSSADSAYLSRTVSTTSNRKTFTFSCWIKRTKSTGSALQIMGSNATSGTNQTAFGFNDTDDTIFVRARNGGSGAGLTTRQFRDSTSWMHLSYVVDTPQTESQAARTKIYVNGVEESVTYNNNHLVNSNLNINLDGTVMEIGALWYNGSHVTNRGEFYLAEVNFVDGQALDPSYFGFTDPVTSIWMPKRYEGTYGTNGFYLDFSDNSSTAALGIDKSPNGNDFTVNNFSVTAGKDDDSMIDTPTNNFPTFNLSNRSTQPTISNGNLRMYYNYKPASKTTRTTFRFPKSGKFYYEWQNEESSSNPGRWQSTIGNVVDIATNSVDINASNNANFVSYSYGGSIWNGTTHVSSSWDGTTRSWYSPERAAWAVDCDTGNIWLGRVASDGTTQWWASDGSATGNPSKFLNPTCAIDKDKSHEYAPIACWHEGGGASSTAFAININFGQHSFLGTIPDGFKTLSSANIQPDPSINTIVRPQKNFDTSLYSNGGGSAVNVDTLEFKPDLIWVKSRNATADNGLYDSVRGENNRISSNLTQVDSSVTGPVPANSGFSIAGTSYYNPSGSAGASTFVAWCWKAGGNSNTFNIDGVGYATAAAAGLDGGTATPTGASVNTKAGFSILKYNGTADQSISHGLSRAPELTIEKELSNSTAWTVTTTGIDGSLDYLYLNTTDAKANYTVDVPTSSLVDIGRNNECIMYMWHSVPGYSKIGNFTGNGSADGSYVHLGFKPAWIILKRASASGNSWGIFDNKRSTSNPNGKSLFSNLNYADYTSNTAVDFLANGFKLRSNATYMNANGSTFLYMAFAETPDATPFDTFPNAK